MADAAKESVNQILADLHAHRVLTMKPEDLQININQRQTLVDTANRAGFLKKGDPLDSFAVTEVGGSTVSLDLLLARGPVVLLFFRFATCPACNLALPYYQRQLYPQLKQLGATLLALSPQIPERLADVKVRHGLSFLVASDEDNNLARKFGILYSFDEASRKQALAKGTPIGDVTGTGTWELPMPAIIVIGQDRIVQFADISPDWLVRTEAQPVLDAVRALSLVTSG